MVVKFILNNNGQICSKYGGQINYKYGGQICSKYGGQIYSKYGGQIYSKYGGQIYSKCGGKKNGDKKVVENKWWFKSSLKAVVEKRW